MINLTLLIYVIVLYFVMANDPGANDPGANDPTHAKQTIQDLTMIHVKPETDPTRQRNLHARVTQLILNRRFEPQIYDPTEAIGI
jgi:hypothetical protein